jgi:hypothetical protein
VYTDYADPAKRLAEYIYAIDFYCRLFPNDDVFFLENSGYPLESDQLFARLAETIKFTCLRFPRSDKFTEGKGYQEFQMLDDAVKRLGDRYDSFIKVTGRYIIRNAYAITAFPCEGLTVDLNDHYRTASTYLLYFRGGFYRNHIMGRFKQVNDNEGHFIEHVIYQAVNDKTVRKSCKLFPSTPLLEGVTGSYGIRMKRNPLRVFIRNMQRRLYRLLGINSFFY